MAKQRKPDDPNCPKRAYCGLRPGIEDEHVVAEAFFPAPRPARNEYILVPACENCNRGFVDDGTRRINMDEEYVRSLFIMEWHAGKHPASRRLLENEIRRSIEYRPALGRLVFGKMRRTRIAVRDEGGLIIPNVTESPLDWERVERVLCKIVKGLYYHETGQRFPDDYTIFIRTLSLLPIQEWDLIRNEAIDRLMDETQMEGPRRLGQGVFSYAYRQTNPKEEPARMLLVMSFYDGIFFGIATYPAAEPCSIESRLPIPKSRVIRL